MKVRTGNGRMFSACLLAISLWLASNSPIVPILLADQPNDFGNLAIPEVTPPVDVRFSGSDHAEVPDFQKHVSPLFGRLGCNGRACHGSFQGQGGFRLSLFGYDFAADAQAIHDPEGGRLDLDTPDESLILAKPSDADFHEGGLRFEVDSWQYRLFRNWIRSGAEGVDSPAVLGKLEVIPSEMIFETGREQVDLKVIAHWADGSREDVTPLCRFQSNDPSVVSVTETGHVQAGDRGDSHVVVFYDNAVQPVPVMRKWSSEPPPAGLNRESFGPIDDLVQGKLDKIGLIRSDLADDATFLRRVCLDITGTLPSEKDVREFLADESVNKRSRKIDELLETPAYAAWWTTFFCDLTGNNTAELRDFALVGSDVPSKMWYEWIRVRVADNMPYDKIVEGIVTAKPRGKNQTYLEYCTEMSRMVSTGECSEFVEQDSMPLYWMRREFQGEDEKANSFAHAFLGLQIQCAQCHKHPFDQWTQESFNGFARFFSGTEVSRPQAPPPADRADAKKIFSDLGFERANVGGNFQQELRKALEEGKTIPIRQLILTRPQMDREKMLELFSEDADSRENRRNRNQRIVYKGGTLPDGTQVSFSGVGDVREPLMEWLRRKDNPYFARALVNRVWSRYFGIGIVDPPDDLNLANPPSNPDLLDWLAESFVEKNYDLKWLHREIANSRTYQTSWQTNRTNAGDRANFARSIPRRLPAEAVVDAIEQVSATDAENQRYFVDLDDRSILIPGTVSGRGARRNASAGFALDIFGRSTRTSSCDCDRSSETSLIQTVYLQNDRDVHFMLNRKDGWLASLSANDVGGDRSQWRAIEKEIEQGKTRIARLKRLARTASEENATAQLQKLNERIAEMEKSIEQRSAVLQASQPEEQAALAKQKEALVESVYLRTLGRFPNPDEVERCKQHLEDYQSISEGMAGVLWALINTSEFVVNH